MQDDSCNSPSKAFDKLERAFSFTFSTINNGLLFLVSSLLLCFSVIAQNVVVQDKVDPVFRQVIAQKDIPVNRKKLPPGFKTEPTEGHVSRTTPLEKRYNCIVYTKNPQALHVGGIVVSSVLPDFVTAWVTLEQILQMASMPEVTHIAAPATGSPQNDVAVGASGASLLHAGKLNNTVYKGKNVIVAIYDTGIDWGHPDFRNPVDQTKSRILRIWDQSISPYPNETSPSGFHYGVEYTQSHINDELDGTPTHYVGSGDFNGHGTHVTGIAAGNGSASVLKKHAGMAPEADLIVIKGNGLDEVGIIDAIMYLKGLATTFGKPIVLNLSTGWQLSAHDGTSPSEAAIDYFTSSGPGRAVVVAAGNFNGQKIHNRISLGGGSNVTVSFSLPNVIPCNTCNDIFQYRIYANDNSNITATFKSPNGESITALAANR